MIYLILSINSFPFIFQNCFHALPCSPKSQEEHSSPSAPGISFGIRRRRFYNIVRILLVSSKIKIRHSAITEWAHSKGLQHQPSHKRSHNFVILFLLNLTIGRNGIRDAWHKGKRKRNMSQSPNTQKSTKKNRVI